jgi:Metallo-beta-lactamase superfamily
LWLGSDEQVTSITIGLLDGPARAAARRGCRHRRTVSDRVLRDAPRSKKEVRASTFLPRARLAGIHGPFPERLIEAGHPREAIDRLICTHLHLDHVGWNTMLVNDKWTATFPNAKYLVHGTEWDFFSKTEDEFLKGPVEDSVRAVSAEEAVRRVWGERCPARAEQAPRHLQTLSTTLRPAENHVRSPSLHPTANALPTTTERSPTENGRIFRNARHRCVAEMCPASRL